MDEQTQTRTDRSAAGWGEVFLAALPFLLILLAEGLPMLLVAGGLLGWEDAGMRILNTGLVILLVGALLAVFALAWRRKWPLWSATWTLIFCLPLLFLLVGLVNLLTTGQLSLTISQEAVIYVWVPLFVAFLLYAVTRLDPRRGLLAALPLIYALWNPNMEFVPDRIEVAVKLPSLALICLTIAFLLRRADWRTGLYAILGMNLAVGALFAWAGIYHGGTLPFTAPGPNLVEVARSLVPQYIATCAILLGPLFAWRFRQEGRLVGRGGVIAYHLALSGLLLVILANLAGLTQSMQARSAAEVSSTMGPLVWLGLGLYLVGIAWLYRYRTYPRAAGEWAQAVLLALLPLGIPLALVLPFISWRWPVSHLYGIPLLWAVPHPVSLTLGLVWLGLSVWVVTRRGGDARPVMVLHESPQPPPPVETAAG